MSGLKRSYSSSKGSPSSRHCSKPPPGSRHKVGDASGQEGGDAPASLFPVVRQADNSRLLPRYNLVLSRLPEDGVGMEDLDQLQHDLEKLLSTAAARNRLLRAEVESIDRVEERRKNKRGRPHEKQLPLKRKKPDERSKCKDPRNGGRLVKAKHSLPVSSFISDVPIKREVPKVSFPKNDTSDKFWLSIEPYCADVTKDDVAFLDDLIQECSQEVDVKVPEVGEHYTIEWSDELLGHERSMSSAQRLAKAKSVNFSNELKKNGLNAMVDTFSSPLTQRLLAALIEEKVVTKIPATSEKLKPSDFSIPKGLPRSNVCMERRLRKELVEQGILDIEDLQKNASFDDEILAEIKKCMQELRTINEKNVSQLNQLRVIVAKDLRRQEVKKALDKVDNQIMELYNKIQIEKQKQMPPAEEDLYSKPASSKAAEAYDQEAQKLIQQQAVLHRELIELTNATMPVG